MNWEIEQIPDKDFIYRRVHINFLKAIDEKDYIPPGAFKDNNGISVDWSKYSTPEKSRERAKEPKKNKILQIKVGHARNIKSISVIHSPLSENRSHSLIDGLKGLTF